MKVEKLTRGKSANLARIAATVTWEDCHRPQQEIYIETDARFDGDLECNPSSFLLAAIMPAMRHGERRILIEGKVCPQLRNGLVTAMQQLRQWYGEKRHQPVTIEATRGFEPPLPRPSQHTASFLSGGVDSLCTLRSNRLDFPLDHPGSIRDCLFVHGYDVGGYVTLHNNRENSEYAVASLSKLAQSAKVTLIPVYTNIRYLDDDDRFFFMDFYGAALAAVAHAFSARIGTALINSGSSISDLGPIGSHPLLDPHYSSADVSIRHEGIRFSRLEKVGIIAQWEEVLHTLRACFNAFRSNEALNCGTCEKCIRTMTELLVFDKLCKCPTYPLDDISVDLVRTIMATPPKTWPTQREDRLKVAYLMLNVANVYYWRELVSPLRNIGRHDLVAVIEAKLAEYEESRARLEDLNWRDAAKGLDRKYLGGTLLKIKRLINGKASRS